MSVNAWYTGWFNKTFIEIWWQIFLYCPIDSYVDNVDYYEVCVNIDILAMQTLFVMEFSPYISRVQTIVDKKINYRR